jgi:hypothetical protein
MFAHTTRTIGRWTAARRRRRRLADELGAYRTPGERAELQAVLARHPEEAAREIERLMRRPEGRRPGW